MEERKRDYSMKNRPKKPESQKQTVPQSRIFAIDVSWVLVAMVVDLGIGFLLKIILGNYFGAPGLGAYTMILVIYLIASTLGGIGIPATLVKYVSEFKDKKSKVNKLVSCGVINSLILGLILTAIIFVISDTLESIFNISNLSVLLRIVALIFPFLLINNALMNVLNGLRKMRLYAVAEIFRRGSILIFTFIFVFLGFGVKGAVWGLVIPAAITTALLLLISKDYLYLSLSKFVETSKTLFSFGSKVFAANILGTINTRADMLFIGFFLLDKDVGIYAVAVMFVHFIMIIPQAVQRITYPAISELWAKNSHKAIENMVNKTMKFTFIFLMPIGILLFFFSKDIIQLIYFNRPHDEFLPAITPLNILIIGVIIRGPLVSVGAALSSIGKPEYTLYVVILITITNICLNILLIPLYGINGAAVATSISFVLGAIVGIYYREKLLKIKIQLNYFVIVGLISIGVYFLMITLDAILEGIIFQIFIGIIGMTIFIGATIITKTLTKDDWKLLKRILNLK